MKLYKSKAIDNAIKKYEALLNEDGFNLYHIADLTHNHYDNNVDINKVFSVAAKATGKGSKIYYSVLDDYNHCATFYFIGAKALAGGGDVMSIVRKIGKEGKKQVNKMLERTKKEEK